MSATTPTVPFAATLMVRDRCLCLHAQRAARVLARRFDEALRHYGLTNEQFSLLMSLNRPQPPSIGAVARTLGADRTTLTAALKPLVREGLAEVSPDPDDRRSRRVALTAAGHEQLVAALPTWLSLHEDLEAGLTAPDAGQMRKGLDTLAAWSTGTITKEETTP